MSCLKNFSYNKIEHMFELKYNLNVHNNADIEKS